MTDHLFVYLDMPSREPLLVGEMYFTTKAGRLVSSTFRYDNGYLGEPAAFPIDPDLPLHAGTASLPGLPGAMQDCSPDRWGRNLITKAHRGTALAWGRTSETLTEVDFLVRVSDLTRQGALRFRTTQEGPLLGDGAHVPALVELPRLLRAAQTASRHDDFAAIKELLDAGTGSLGGARPKASLRDGEGLFIAKFPHPDDDWDVMSWEKTALDLAQAAGIRVPRTRLTRADGRCVLLLERFDRRGRERVPYISAMTMLTARDGDSHDYLEIAEVLPEVSAATTADLNELWRRIAFSVLINNTDDHLRNHGFLRTAGGWRLSPVFDVNPNPDAGTTRQTAVGGAHRREHVLEALHAHAKHFDLTPASAAQVLSEIVTTVAGWREVAARNQVNAKDLERFADAFWTVSRSDC